MLSRRSTPDLGHHTRGHVGDPAVGHQLGGQSQRAGVAAFQRDERAGIQNDGSHAAPTTPVSEAPSTDLAQARASSGNPPASAIISSRTASASAQSGSRAARRAK